jgi:hypothetical protein
MEKWSKKQVTEWFHTNYFDFMIDYAHDTRMNGKKLALLTEQDIRHPLAYKVVAAIEKAICEESVAVVWRGMGKKKYRYF